jgi:NAD(P)-dependent dehydrogenase (short-subunit alcohol dehydrogenase family)
MILERFALTDKVAMITGAGRGIGRGIATGLAEAGADIIALSRTAGDIDSVAAEARALGRRALAIPTDVRSADEIDKAIKRTLDEFGRIDILVNNAGGASAGVFPSNVTDMSEELWDEIIRGNLKHVFLFSRAVAKVMIEQKSGAIVNISSLFGSTAAPMFAPYGASKAAINDFTQTLAYELAPHNIRVNGISPGLILTSSTEMLWTTPELRDKAAKDVYMKRLGYPEDVAPLAVFLASDAAGYVTGQTFDVNGGWGALVLL